MYQNSQADILYIDLIIKVALPLGENSQWLESEILLQPELRGVVAMMYIIPNSASGRTFVFTERCIMYSPHLFLYQISPNHVLQLSKITNLTSPSICQTPTQNGPCQSLWAQQRSKTLRTDSVKSLSSYMCGSKPWNFVWRITFCNAHK